MNEFPIVLVEKVALTIYEILLYLQKASVTSAVLLNIGTDKTVPTRIRSSMVRSKTALPRNS